MDKNKIKSFADKVYGDMAGAMAMGMAYIGVQKGLFAAISGQGPLTKDAIISATSLQPRYVEEWLSGMTAAGYLEYNPQDKKFVLPDEHSFLVDSEGTDHYMGGLFLTAPLLLKIAPAVADAFEFGGGVKFDEFGPECVDATDIMSVGQYEQRLVSYWLPQLPDVMEKLGHGCRVLDVGCGSGRVAMSIAEAFPNAAVDGLDPDEPSIRRARSMAKERGLEEKITFTIGTTNDHDYQEPFDLITAFDCVHDFAQPKTTLEEIRALLGPQGTLLIVEPNAADNLEDNIHALGTVYYGFSIFHCMTQSLANGGVGLGTCMGPRKTKVLLLDAGFGKCEQLDIRSKTHLFYAAQP